MFCGLCWGQDMGDGVMLAGIWGCRPPSTFAVLPLPSAPTGRSKSTTWRHPDCGPATCAGVLQLTPSCDCIRQRMLWRASARGSSPMAMRSCPSARPPKSPAGSSAGHGRTTRNGTAMPNAAPPRSRWSHGQAGRSCHRFLDEAYALLPEALRQRGLAAMSPPTEASRSHSQIGTLPAIEAALAWLPNAELDYDSCPPSAPVGQFRTACVAEVLRLLIEFL